MRINDGLCLCYILLGDGFLVGRRQEEKNDYCVPTISINTESPKAIRLTDQTDHFFNHSRLSEAGQIEKWALEIDIHSAVLTYLYPTYYPIYQFIERSTM